MLAAAATALSATAHAGDAEGRYAIKGVGLVPCSAFIQSLQQQQQEAGLFLSWLSGYLTGANVFAENTYDMVSWQDEGVLANALASTCSQMPDQPVGVAASQLLPLLAQTRIPTAEKPEEIVVGEQRRLLYPSVVRALQQGLKDKGQTLTVDGDFGPGTQTAIRAFQKSAGIPETGFPDAVTMIALFANQTPPPAGN